MPKRNKNSKEQPKKITNSLTNFILLQKIFLKKILTQTTMNIITTKVQIIINGRIKIDITAKYLLSVKIH